MSTHPGHFHRDISDLRGLGLWVRDLRLCEIRGLLCGMLMYGADGKIQRYNPSLPPDRRAAGLNPMDSARPAWENLTPGRASEGGADMETFAVTVFPVAKPDEWQAWVASIASGDRADAHRQMMRRLGIKREHIRHQASPGGDVMVLVWEGVEQDRAPELLADLVQNPQSEHERYIANHVIPDLHGADPTAGPPPTVQNVATIET